MRLLRPRFTILTLTVVVAISAIVMSWFRPISRAEAEKIAEAKFLKIPRASRWIGRYRVHASLGESERYANGWSVVLSDPKDGIPLMQMFLAPKGKMRAIDFVPGKFNECPLCDPGLQHVHRAIDFAPGKFNE
jgi:hypothetical protein